MRKALIATGILAMMGAVAAASPSGAATRPHSARTAAHHKAVSPKAPVGTTLLATFTGATAVYSAPNQGTPTVEGPTWQSAPMVLPVIAEKGTWLDVRLPQRPNGTTGWVQDSQVTLSYTPYVVKVTLSTSPTLTLLDKGQTVFTAPIGAGAPVDPTPTGDYFVAYKGNAPSAGYGPFILVTSAHSNAIQNWEGSGDASTGIHGPLGSTDIPGYPSHGCIRMQIADLEKLAVVPAGTPVDIVQ